MPRDPRSTRSACVRSAARMISSAGRPSTSKGWTVRPRYVTTFLTRSSTCLPHFFVTRISAWAATRNFGAAVVSRWSTRSSGGSTTCRTVTCDVAGTFCAQSNRAATNACSDSSTAKKDPQTSCTLTGRSSPSSAADQDRARCRIEHAIARRQFLLVLPTPLALLLPKHKHRARTVAQGFVRLSNKDLEERAVWQRPDNTPLPDGIAECHREAISRQVPSRNCAGPPLSRRSRGETGRSRPALWPPSRSDRHAAWRPLS